jgi:hypothetical protein
MKKFSIVHPLVFSFFSKELYQAVARDWKGVGFSYLLLLLALVWLPEAVKMHAGVKRFATQEAPKFVRQIPTITISQGEVSIKEPMPYKITDPDSGELVAVIDTTGEINSLDNTKAHLLLTKTKLMGRKNAAETRVYDLTGVEDFVLTQERLNNWLQIGSRWLAVVVYPFAVVFSYIYRILQVLLYAAIGLLFAYWMNVRLSYSTLLRLAAVSVTPAIVVNTVVGLAAQSPPFWALICFAIAMAYLFFAVKANTDPTNTTP